MGKILIANLGNRTLVNKNSDGTHKEYDTKKTGKDSFREATKSDWECIELDESYLDLNIFDSNILDEVIKKEDTIDRIYLFSSDQAKSNEKQQRKDTVYAGKILSKLLPKKYPSLFKPESIKVITLTGVSVVDLNQLTTRFKAELLDLVDNKHKGEKFVICDSGGTSQQKNALKIVAEYFLDEKNVTFYQVHEGEEVNGIIERSHAEKQDFFQIRKISDAQNISLLINLGEYNAAASIIGKAIKSKAIYDLLLLMHYRLLLRDEDARKQILGNTPFNIWVRSNPYYAKDYPSIAEYLKQEPRGEYSNWSNEFSKENFFRLCEMLELGRFYYFKNDWSNVVLSYHVFIETFVSLISKKRQYQGSKDLSYKIDFLDTQNLIPSLQDFLNDFKQLHSNSTGRKSLNTLRNQIAHEGKGVTEDDIKTRVPNFFSMVKTWHNKFGVSEIKEENAFIKANQSLQIAMQKE